MSRGVGKSYSISEIKRRIEECKDVIISVKSIEGAGMSYVALKNGKGVLWDEVKK